MKNKYSFKNLRSRILVLASLVLGSLTLAACLVPTDYFVLAWGGYKPGSTTEYPEYKILWPEQNAKFQMFCFKPAYQGSTPTIGEPSGWLYAFDNLLVGNVQDVTQVTAILNEVAVSDSTGTLYTGKWGQNSPSIYGPDFRRYLSPASYCWGPVQSHPGIPGCGAPHTCRKAELFPVHFSATTGQADFIGPIYSTNTLNNCVIAGSPNTVAGMISRAISCQKERVLRVYLPFS